MKISESCQYVDSSSAAIATVAAPEKCKGKGPFCPPTVT